jgi:hypothetical protein
MTQGDSDEATEEVKAPAADNDELKQANSGQPLFPFFQVPVYVPDLLHLQMVISGDGRAPARRSSPYLHVIVNHFPMVADLPSLLPALGSEASHRCRRCEDKVIPK